MANNETSNFLISSFLTFFVLVLVHPTQAHTKGFTTNLIHRDSPLSPLGNPSVDKYERIRNSIRRSWSKLNRYSTSTSSNAQSEVKSSYGEYIMELSYGTPPVPQLGIIDTGSDLIWTQCQPCLQCFNQTLPIFDPSKSSTYKPESCDSQGCKSFHTSQITCSSNNTCGYTYAYSDGAQSTGDLASETITFGSIGPTKGVSFPNVTFGCGHDNVGTFERSGAGLVGLGCGSKSLVSQLGSLIGGKFSYCLIPSSMEGNHTSKISFGTDAEVSGPSVISTPIVKGVFINYYYLTLEGISVENTKIPFNGKSSIDGANDAPSNEGNIIIDSGTPLTFLPTEMFDSLNSALEGIIKGEKVDDPTGLMDLCYKTRNGISDLNIPNVTAHIDGGDLELKPYNTFVSVSEEVSCLAMVPLRGLPSAILGNIAQTNMLIGYDNVNGKLSFKPTDCTEEQ
ncbi:aspartic proteinase CDR1-like [Silene latifolia]|uniref:aspartic proteinase CDR1-like n=1 Tax=Silene latifolia TaxID=37657 RepID=UPI003D77E182